MSERVYVIGSTGNVGSATVKELLKNDIPVTVYVRSPAKAKELFANHANLTFVQGDWNDLKPFEESIVGHTRLFLLVHGLQDLVKIKSAIAQRAYAAGVKQIVHVSGVAVGDPWRSNYIGGVHRESEEAILAIPNRGAYVTLRPGRFMVNNITFEINPIKFLSAILDTEEPDTVQTWISTNDIGLVAANIFKDPIEKHGDAVYELIGDALTFSERAALLSKALRRTITYKKVSYEEKYSNLVQRASLPHRLAYDFLQPEPTGYKVTPGLSILLGRQPETFAQWLEANKARFHEN
ncbi:hypothetical protein BJV82DRAFT_606616 [Fennellomyces sp. T-0311]|nr:hypothetical protein BJV82DRAFT_606616 [Fennellomyces sp. T-0311]